MLIIILELACTRDLQQSSGISQTSSSKLDMFIDNIVINLFGKKFKQICLKCHNCYSIQIVKILTSKVNIVRKLNMIWKWCKRNF